MSREIKVGDRVVTRDIYSPEMIVLSKDGDELLCMWFDKNDTIFKEKIHASMLMVCQEGSFTKKM